MACEEYEGALVMLTGFRGDGEWSGFCGWVVLWLGGVWEAWSHGRMIC